nr:hypothetical protein CFP56_70680 [Quercus suber]
MSTSIGNGNGSGLLAEHLRDGVSEKLALLKLSAINESEAHDGISEPETTTGGRGEGRPQGLSSFASSAGAGALTRTARHASSMTTRRTTSFMQSHRHKMSLELSAQAEKRFATLMELMDSAYKEATNVKEYWSQLMSERESDDREKEQLLMQIEEISQTLEQKDTQHGHHRREAANRKKELDKLLIEFTSTLAVVTEQKKTITDREIELERSHLELSDMRAAVSRSHVEHDQLRANFESAQAKWRVIDGELVIVKGIVFNLTREHSDLESRSNSIAVSLESARKDNSVFTERSRMWEVEKTEMMFEKDKGDASLRKQTLKTEEVQRELSDLTEHNERLHREHAKFREIITKLELERDEHQSVAARSRTEAREYAAKYEESEEQRTDALLKLEQSKRHVIRKEESLIEKESEIADLQKRLDGKHEECRLLTVERDQVKDDLISERKVIHDTRHKITTLEELLAQTETKVTQQRAEVYTVSERVKHVERERDEAREKHNRTSSEIESLKAKILLLQSELRTAHDGRDHLHEEVERYRRKYEEVTETIEEWNNDSGDLEFEIESLRVMLREAREQKEKAIAARNTADRERDEHISLYEDKCRELERFEESGSRAAYVNASSHGHSSSSRIVSSKSARTSSVRKSYSGEGKIEEDGIEEDQN